MMRANALRRAGLATALALALAGGVAHAALFDDEEARKRIAETNVRLTQVQKQLEDRIATLEQQLKSQGLVEMFGAVEQRSNERRPDDPATQPAGAAKPIESPVGFLN